MYVVGARGATGLVLTVASEVFEESGRSLVRGTLDYLQGLKVCRFKILKNLNTKLKLCSYIITPLFRCLVLSERKEFCPPEVPSLWLAR